MIAPSRLQPAFWGGLFIGVLSALPLVNAANCCCCLWVLAGGVLATYLYQQQTLPVPVTAQDGALVGLLAGAIGGVIGSVLSIPIQMMTGPLQQQFMERILSSNPEITPEMRDMMERFATGAGFRIVSMLVTIVVYTVFGLLGGLIGASIVKRKVPPAPPAGTVDVLPPE